MKGRCPTFASPITSNLPPPQATSTNSAELSVFATAVFSASSQARLHRLRRGRAFGGGSGGLRMGGRWGSEGSWSWCGRRFLRLRGVDLCEESCRFLAGEHLGIYAGGR